MATTKNRKSLDDRINEYFRKCIDGSLMAAKDAAGKDGDKIDEHPEYWYNIIGMDLLFDCKRPSNGTAPWVDQAFFRRLIYRLHNNMYKNFGLNFYSPELEHYAMECTTMKYEICDNREFNYEHGIDQVRIFDQVKVICSHDVLRPYTLRVQDELDNGLARLQDAGLDIYSAYSFADYYRAYAAVFGESPIETWVRVNSGLPLYMSSDEIEKQAWVSFQRMGCTYANICGLYKADVCGADKCMRFDATMFKEGFSMKRYKEIRQIYFATMYREYCAM